jgi:PII-like signaling protein
MTHGFLITFFTQRSREHDDRPLARWIIDQAMTLGIRGATLSTAQEGFGHDGRYHSNGYFDMQDPPQKLAMAVTAEEYSQLMAVLKANNLKVFHTKAEIEFGFSAED